MKRPTSTSVWEPPANPTLGTRYTQQTELNRRFSALKSENERIDVALKALAP